MYTAILDDGTRIECRTYEHREGGIVLLDEDGGRIAFVPTTSLAYAIRDGLAVEEEGNGRTYRLPE